MKEFNREPEAEAVRQNPDGSKFLPIEYVETILDQYNWSTRNFQHTIFKNGYADLCVAASLEVVVKYVDGDEFIERTFVGAASFSLKSIDPNPHFLATAKSECVKNAASDIGKFFGRGLNNDVTPFTDKSNKPPAIKSRPDTKIMQAFLKAVETKDEATIIMLSNIYDIKTQSDAQEK